MVLRLKTSIIGFSSFFYYSLFCYTFSQYRIWAPKDDSRDIACGSSFPFPSSPSCVIGFASSVSDTYALFYFSSCSSLSSGAKIADALVMVVIAACVGLNDLSNFTQDTAISWDVDELYSRFF